MNPPHPWNVLWIIMYTPKEWYHSPAYEKHIDHYIQAWDDPVFRAAFPRSRSNPPEIGNWAHDC